MTGVRRLVYLPVVVLAAAVLSTVVVAHAANLPVPGGRLAVSNQAASAGQFKPSACTGSVTSIVVVSGAGLFTVGTANALIVGTSGNDNVRATTGYSCFVGGGPTSSNKDKFTGAAGGGDQCVVAASDPATNIRTCTIVQRSP